MPRASIDDLRRADRVLVHGVTGSGKSTLAVALGARLDLPVQLVDDEIGWLPGWVARDPDEQRALAARIASRPRWVLDSSYGQWRDIALARAQVVVALDLPRALTFARLLRRTTLRLLRRTPVCNGNVESARVIFSRDSILLWHAQSFARKRASARAMEAAVDGVPVLRLTRPKQVRRALAALLAT